MRGWIALVLIGAASASAQPHTLAPEAREHYERGQRAFEVKDYDAAIAEFRAGYAIESAPVFLYNRAQAERLAGRCADAIASYRAFLATNPTGEFKDHATYNLGACQLQIKPAPPPPPAVVTAAREPAPAIWYRDPVGLALVGPGLAGAAVAAGAFIAARRQAELSRSAPTLGEFESHKRDADRDRLVGYLAGGVGTALLAGGAIRFAFVRAHALSVAPLATATGASISVGGRF